MQKEGNISFRTGVDKMSNSLLSAGRGASPDILKLPSGVVLNGYAFKIVEAPEDGLFTELENRLRAQELLAPNEQLVDIDATLNLTSKSDVDAYDHDGVTLAVRINDLDTENDDDPDYLFIIN